MDAFTAFKYINSQREEDLRKIAQILIEGHTNSLAKACLIAGVDPKSLSNSEINFIKRIVG